MFTQFELENDENDGIFLGTKKMPLGSGKSTPKGGEVTPERGPPRGGPFLLREEIYFFKQEKITSGDFFCLKK